ncbi:NAD-dependent formate dehydrogenase alpha subunit [Photobacterium aphoticum]|uniref:NAD-dependent formate dehydrogenase alpha subunit n=1 Tax=Photobacterium aphoticum TaxID=754436 RepID=A0A090R687_9GAMM|nr:NAD-dependent formate dehydrogenase alpha subunit [Photobacterium aphoticum]
MEASLGSGAMTNDIPSIQHSDLIFIIGSDTTAAHPIIASHIKQALRAGKARLVVADPKHVEIADHASLYVAHRPGTDVMLLNGIMQQIIKNGWQDEAYIAERVTGFDVLKDEVMREDYSPANVELITGVKPADLLQMAEMIGTAERTAVYYSMGITQHTTGHDNVRSIANLQMLCGNIGIEGGGINRCVVSQTYRVRVTWVHCRKTSRVTRKSVTQRHTRSLPKRGIVRNCLQKMA